MSIKHFFSSLHFKLMKRYFYNIYKIDAEKLYWLERQIGIEESYIKSDIDCMLRPDVYKRDTESLEDYIAKYNKFIEEHRKNILRLKAGDYKLCKTLFQQERDA